MNRYSCFQSFVPLIVNIINNSIVGSFKMHVLNKVLDIMSYIFTDFIGGNSTYI